VTWYDCRNSPGNNTAQIFGTVSVRRGRLWEPNVQIGAGLSNGLSSGTGGFNFGDYDTMDYNSGRFYRSWGDNTNPSQLTPQNNSTSTMDVGTARVDVSAGLAPFSGGDGLTAADVGNLTGALKPVGNAATILVAPPANTSNQAPTTAVVRALDTVFTN